MQDFLLLQPVAERLYRPCRAAIAVVALKPALAQYGSETLWFPMRAAP